MNNIDNNYELKTTLSPAAGFGFLACLFIVMYVIVAVLTGILMGKMSNFTAAVRITTLIQDLFVFILPAVVTALLMTRLPARFLFLDVVPRLWPVLLSVATLFAALPCMNRVIEWNEGITFPESLHAVETALRQAETTAQEFVNGILQGASPASLIVSICIVGLLAALAEELFFRGALLRLFLQARLNHHVAIWVVAFIFSLLHFQFFGFVPRMLLGAYFGYLVWWTRCLWIPVIVHAVNNSTVVVAQWAGVNNGAESVVNTIGGADTHWMVLAGSLVLTVSGLLLMRKNSQR